MRNDLTYIGALQSIGSGFAQLGVCIYNTIIANKALTLLVISLVANIMLTLASYHVGDYTEATDADLLSRMRADLQLEYDQFQQE